MEHQTYILCVKIIKSLSLLDPHHDQRLVFHIKVIQVMVLNNVANKELTIMPNNEIIDYYEEPSSDDRVLAMLIYVSSFFTTIIGPLIIWLVKKENSSFVDKHGKEYFNFIISYTIYSIIGAITIVLFIGLIILPVVGLLWFIFTIVGAVKAFNGEVYRIPLTIPFIK